MGRWVGRLRDKMDKLTSEQISRLDSLGFDCDPFTTSWDEGFNNLEKYLEKNKNALVPARKKLSDGFFLVSGLLIKEMLIKSANSILKKF